MKPRIAMIFMEITPGKRLQIAFGVAFRHDAFCFHLNGE